MVQITPAHKKKRMPILWTRHIYSHVIWPASQLQIFTLTSRRYCWKTLYIKYVYFLDDSIHNYIYIYIQRGIYRLDLVSFRFHKVFVETSQGLLRDSEILALFYRECRKADRRVLKFVIYLPRFCPKETHALQLYRF